MVKCVVRGHAGELRGRSIRILIGSRLQARRNHLGFTIDGVAEELGIEPSAYETYEAGEEHAPALVLGGVADLFGVPVFWFFQDVFAVDVEDEQPADGGDRPRVYRVATLEERLGFLGDAFRTLDLEGQQQVLATATALRPSNPKPAHEGQCRDSCETPSSKPVPSRVQRISRLQNPSPKFK